MSTEVIQNHSAIHKAEMTQSDSDKLHAKELIEYARSLILTLRNEKKGKGDINLKFQSEQIDLHTFLPQIEEFLSDGEHSIEELQNINQLIQSAIDQVKAKPKKSFGCNVGMAMRPLVINHDRVGNKKINDLIDEGEALVEVMNRSRQMAQDLKSAKSDIEDHKYQPEELFDKIQSYQAFIKSYREKYPELLKNIPNPIDSDLKLDDLKADSSYFNLNYDEAKKFIDKSVDKVAEVITCAQGILPTVTIRMHKAMKESIINFEILHRIYDRLAELNRHIIRKTGG